MLTQTHYYLFEHGLLEQTSQEFQTLLENRIDFLKKQHPTHHTLIDYLSAEADPTPNKKYTEWLTHRALKGDLLTTTAQIREGLTWFSKARPTAHDTNIKNHTVSSMLDTAHIVKHTLGEAPAPMEKLYDQDGVQAFKIPNKATSIKMYGPGAKHESRWCTAANSSNNRFDETTGDKITIHLPNGRFMQFNHDSAQLKDEENKDVKLSSPDIHPYYDHIKHIVSSTAPGGTESYLTSWHFPTTGHRRITHGKLSDDEFHSLAESHPDKLAQNPFLKDHQYEHLFNTSTSTHPYLAVNHQTPQHLIDRMDSENIDTFTRGYSPEKLHKVIDGAKAYWANQDTAPSGDARHLSALSRSPNQKFNHDHIEKLASVHPNGEYAMSAAMVNIGINNSLPQKFVSKSFKKIFELREQGLKDPQDFKSFIHHNTIDDQDFVDVAHGAGDSTAYDLLSHPKVPQEAKDVIVRDLRQSPEHYRFLKDNLHDENIPDDLAKSVVDGNNVNNRAIESYSNRKNADIHFIHNKLVSDHEKLPEYAGLYSKKLPIEIAAHPTHVFNVSTNIDSNPHFTKDDLHTVITSLHKWSNDNHIQPSSKFVKSIINHPSSNQSHYEKIHQLFGNDSLFMDVLKEHPKVPRSLKDKID